MLAVACTLPGWVNGAAVMRRTIFVAGVLAFVLALGVALLLSRSAPHAAHPASAANDRSPGPDHADDATSAALDRLRSELRRSPPVQRRADQERVEDARAWVSANRPHDWPYAEHEARTLAFWVSVAEGEKRSARWLLDNAALEIDAIRSLDADGDGLATDEEVEAFAAFQSDYMNLREHPYLVARLDTNRDGMVGSDELMALAGGEANTNRFDGVFERVRLDRWDADGDGLLDDEERSAGLSALHQLLRIDERGAIEIAEDPDPSAPARNEASLAALAALHGDAYAESIRQQAAYLALQRLASDFLRSSSVIDWFALPPPENLAPPVMPNPADYSDDGSNRLVGDRLDAFMRAMEDYEREFHRFSTLAGIRRSQAQFAAAVGESDLDGDGLLSPYEWERRATQLIEARDERLFNMHYDLDRNGRVETHEVDTFLRWYRAGSLRADANFDGAIDAGDLEEMIRSVERQERR